MIIKKRYVICFMAVVGFICCLFFLNHMVYADVIYSENGKIKEVDTSFSGIGSEYITFRTYMNFYVINTLTGETIKEIPFESGTSNSSVEGTYYLELNGTRIATYVNTGDDSKLYFEENYDSKIKEYLEGNADTNNIKYVTVKFNPIVKIYSRKKYVGPYNYDSDQNNYWDSLDDCEASGWAVYVKKGSGRDTYGNRLSGFYSLNQTQKDNIIDIYGHGKYLKFDYILDIDLTVDYKCNGGNITIDDRTLSEYIFSQKSSLGDVYVINEIPKRNNCFFWYWSTKKYEVNKGIIGRDDSDVFFFDSGDTIDFISENHIILYACWGTCPLGEFDSESEHICKYKKSKQKYGTCENCGGDIYCYLYKCIVCGDEMASEPEILSHTCTKSTLGILNGCCTVCDDTSEDYIGTWIEGQNVLLYEPEKYGIHREGHSFLYYAENYNGTGQKFYPGDTYSFSGFGEVRTIYAIYEPQKFNITFDFNKESAPYAVIKGENITMTVSYDAYISDLPIPEIDKGYIFLGWYSKSLSDILILGERFKIAANETLIAKYSPMAFDINLDINWPNGAQNMTNAGIDSKKAGVYTAKYGKEFKNIIPLNVIPECDGYEFMGWYISDDENDEKKEYVNGSDVFLYMKDISVKGCWTIKTYTITLDPGEEAKILDMEPGEKYYVKISYGEKLAGEYALPDAQKYGFDFIGWNTRELGTGEKIKNGDIFLLSEDITLYPDWSGKTYKITFDYSEKWKYDATDLKNADIKYMYVRYDDLIGDLPKPTRYGYMFKGWSTKKVTYDNKSTGDPDADMVLKNTRYNFFGDVTLYAVWEAVKVNVGYDYNYEYTVKVPLQDIE